MNTLDRPPTRLIYSSNNWPVPSNLRGLQRWLDRPRSAAELDELLGPDLYDGIEVMPVRSSQIINELGAHASLLATANNHRVLRISQTWRDDTPGSFGKGLAGYWQERDWPQLLDGGRHARRLLIMARMAHNMASLPIAQQLAANLRPDDKIPLTVYPTCEDGYADFTGYREHFSDIDFQLTPEVLGRWGIALAENATRPKEVDEDSERMADEIVATMVTRGLTGIIFDPTHWPRRNWPGKRKYPDLPSPEVLLPKLSRHNLLHGIGLSAARDDLALDDEQFKRRSRDVLAALLADNPGEFMQTQTAAVIRFALRLAWEQAIQPTSGIHVKAKVPDTSLANIGVRHREAHVQIARNIRVGLGIMPDGLAA